MVLNTSSRECLRWGIGLENGDYHVAALAQFIIKGHHLDLFDGSAWCSFLILVE
jgi:hypothetical protein